MKDKDYMGPVELDKSASVPEYPYGYEKRKKEKDDGKKEKSNRK